MVILVGVNALAPALPAKGEAERSKRVAVSNNTFQEKVLTSSDHNLLSSPVIGAGIPIDRVNQLILLADKFDKDPVRFVWDGLNGQGQRIIKDGGILQTEAENTFEIKTRVSNFEKKFALVLRRLQII